MKQALYEEMYYNREGLFLLASQDLIDFIGTETMADVNRKRTANGVRGRSPRIRSKLMPFPTSAQTRENLLTVSITPEGFTSSMGIGIYDTGKVGFFSSKNEGFVIMIESRESGEVMRNFYEMLWSASEPIQEGQG